MGENRHWMIVASKDRVDHAVAGGFAQLNRGEAAPLERMRAGDGLVFYSPRTAYPDGEPLQAFTAIGRIRTGTVYQATRGQSTPLPNRRRVPAVAGQPDQAADCTAVVHAQQGALGRRVPPRRALRPGVGFLADCRSDGLLARERRCARQSRGRCGELNNVV